MILNEPHNPDGGQIGWKVFLWLLIWGILAFLVFVLMSLLGNEFFTNSEWLFLWLIFVIIACMVTLIGVGIFSGLLNLMFGQDYYDFGKMFGLSVLSNGLLVLLFLPLYMMFSDSIHTLMTVYAVHVMFAFFVSYTLIEMTTNPSYSASTLMWTTLGFGSALVIYMMIYTMTKESALGQNILYVYVLSPLVLSYILLPLCHSIREKIYYSIYSNGSNPLFIPPVSDVAQTTEQVDEVTVDLTVW